MRKPDPHDPTGGKARSAAAGADLSWRQFFQRLGDGTLHDDAAGRVRRANPELHHETRERPAATTAR